MSEKQEFLTGAAAKAADKVHFGNIQKAVSSFEAAFTNTKATQFRDWEGARADAARVKDAGLARLPELLESFEAGITARGAEVLWAEDANEARAHMLDIVSRHQARRIVKSKSMVTEEIELNELLEGAGLDVLESDLGELIVQLAHEKPYHIVAPAIHKTKEDIARLFHEKLGSALDATPEELTMVARAHLRDAYLRADIGVTGANFLIADEGAIVITENEGNGRLTSACPPVHVAICGIEKILPRLADLPLFLPLLATAGTGQQITSYNSVIRGPRQKGETDGPEKMYLILLDNGRSRLYGNTAVRHSLRCIRCGACLNTCPIFRTVGGHTYNTPYQGPIGSVITPHLRGMREWNHLSYASSLCGSCSDVCPVNIDLHHLLLENRRQADEAGAVGRFWPLAMKIWAYVMQSRRRLRRFRVFGQAADHLPAWMLPKFVRERMPRLAEKSFARQWTEAEDAR